jgi:hypothetical protein
MFIEDDDENLLNTRYIQKILTSDRETVALTADGKRHRIYRSSLRDIKAANFPVVPAINPMTVIGVWYDEEDPDKPPEITHYPVVAWIIQPVPVFADAITGIPVAAGAVIPEEFDQGGYRYFLKVGDAYHQIHGDQEVCDNLDQACKTVQKCDKYRRDMAAYDGKPRSVAN